ncbi:hypothetical protein H8B09_09995 [Paenibacillus sp. PR3]|uniref:Thioredoxin domain-containing protein n=1 Tax=Paenibacillus terricola TaxID=2763503 RepID=A0ABR8MVJ6_9BACL|nr:hypothetical protein [Paenibacillus terricola]MBD3919086.1 hypothetical protein [Paenibacillus terricola]
MNMASISNIVLWLLVLSLTMLTLTIAKKPTRMLGASASGLPVGTLFPKFNIQSVVEHIPFSVSYPDKQGTLLLFSASTCPVCSTVYPLFPYAEKKYDLKTQVIMDGAEDHDGRIVLKLREAGISAPIYGLTPSIKAEVKLEGFPFAYYLSADGRVLSKGMINTAECIDLLVRQGRRSSMKLAG